MNALLSGLCALVAIVVVAFAILYSAYCVIIAVFGEGESGQAVVVLAICVTVFFGFLAGMARFNTR